MEDHPLIVKYEEWSTKVYARNLLEQISIFVNKNYTLLLTGILDTEGVECFEYMEYEQLRYIQLRQLVCSHFMQPVLDILHSDTNNFEWSHREAYNISISLSLRLNELLNSEYLEIIEAMYRHINIDINGVLDDFYMN